VAVLALELRSGVSPPKLDVRMAFFTHAISQTCPNDCYRVSILEIVRGNGAIEELNTGIKGVSEFLMKTLRSRPPSEPTIGTDPEAAAFHSVSNKISSDRPSSIIALCRIKLNMGYKGAEKSISYQ